MIALSEIKTMGMKDVVIHLAEYFKSVELCYIQSPKKEKFDHGKKVLRVRIHDRYLTINKAKQLLAKKHKEKQANEKIKGIILDLAKANGANDIKFSKTTNTAYFNIGKRKFRISDHPLRSDAGRLVNILLPKPLLSEIRNKK